MSNYCQRFKDANNFQTTKSDASSVVFLLGKLCQENSFLSFSPFFSCQNKAVLFLPLLSLSPSPQSVRARSFFCSPPYKATTINMTFRWQKSILCEKICCFYASFLFGSISLNGNCPKTAIEHPLPELPFELSPSASILQSACAQSPCPSLLMGTLGTCLPSVDKALG